LDEKKVIRYVLYPCRFIENLHDKQTIWLGEKEKVIRYVVYTYTGPE
jgi:hypothetical protein